MAHETISRAASEAVKTNTNISQVRSWLKDRKGSYTELAQFLMGNFREPSKMEKEEALENYYVVLSALPDANKKNLRTKTERILASRLGELIESKIYEDKELGFFDRNRLIHNMLELAINIYAPDILHDKLEGLKPLESIKEGLYMGIYHRICLKEALDKNQKI